MSQDMLGNLALTHVWGPLRVLMKNLAGPEGKVFLQELQKFNRRQPCWPTKEAEERTNDKFLGPYLLPEGTPSSEDELITAARLHRINRDARTRFSGTCGPPYYGELWLYTPGRNLRIAEVEKAVRENDMQHATYTDLLAFVAVHLLPGKSGKVIALGSIENPRYDAYSPRVRFDNAVSTGNRMLDICRRHYVFAGNSYFLVRKAV